MFSFSDIINLQVHRAAHACCPLFAIWVHALCYREQIVHLQYPKDHRQKGWSEEIWSCGLITYIQSTNIFTTNSTNHQNPCLTNYHLDWTFFRISTLWIVWFSQPLSETHRKIADSNKSIIIPVCSEKICLSASEHISQRIKSRFYSRLHWGWSS